jgi:hypothetical protein
MHVMRLHKLQTRCHVERTRHAQAAHGSERVMAAHGQDGQLAAHGHKGALVVVGCKWTRASTASEGVLPAHPREGVLAAYGGERVLPGGAVKLAWRHPSWPAGQSLDVRWRQHGQPLGTARL